MLPPPTFENLQALSFEELHTHFNQGTAPDLQEMSGDTRGKFLAWNPKACWVMKLLIRWMFRHWLGKRFFPSQAADQTASGINLFRDRHPTRYQFRTYISKARMGGAPCLCLDYNLPGSLRGLIDDVKKVAEGLVLGQINYQLFWQKSPTFYLYFTLERTQRPVVEETSQKSSKRIFVVAGIIALAVVGFLGFRYATRDIPNYYPTIEEHFKYGSIGTDRDTGVPYWIWKVLPTMFPEKISPQGYQSFGFIFEPGHERAIGMTNRVVAVERVGLNCAVCHTGTVRDTPASPPRVILGMPANRLNLQGYFRFLVECGKDPRFTAGNVMAEIHKVTRLSWMESVSYYVGFFIVKQRLGKKGEQNSFMTSRPDWGPGRVDTFNPYKAYFRMDTSADTTIGTADLPSIWNQKAREDLWLHWDGDNNKVHERNISAALAVGAAPDTLDFDSLKRIEDWISVLPPPAYPYQVNRDLAAQGNSTYLKYCAGCHAFGGAGVGQVVLKTEIGTDPHRTDSFTSALVEKMNTLGTGHPWKLSHYRKTDGYSSVPLDGIWARAPYLHNGSVPTLWDLLLPPAQRPPSFYRGYDVYDREHVGFVSAGPEAEATGWKFDVTVPGNGNLGHLYGTDLSPEERKALVEYMKTL